MKIISDFHDFYDAALVHHDAASEVVYQRKTISFSLKNKQDVDKLNPLCKEIVNKFKKFLHHDHRYISKIGGFFEFSPWSFNNDKNFSNKNYLNSCTYASSKVASGTQVKFLVIFCGKLYPGIQFDIQDIKPDGGSKRVIIYSEATFNDLMDEYKFKLATSADYNLVKHFFSATGQSVETEFLIANKITNAVLYDNFLHINDCLADISFFKVFDAFTCYQELNTWMAGTLSYPQNIMIEVGDKSKIEKHGFDLKYGFRTRPRRKL